MGTRSIRRLPAIAASVAIATVLTACAGLVWLAVAPTPIAFAVQASRTTTDARPVPTPEPEASAALSHTPDSWVLWLLVGVVIVVLCGVYAVTRVHRDDAEGEPRKVANIRRPS